MCALLRRYYYVQIEFFSKVTNENTKYSSNNVRGSYTYTFTNYREIIPLKYYTHKSQIHFFFFIVRTFYMNIVNCTYLKLYL